MRSSSDFQPQCSPSQWMPAWLALLAVVGLVVPVGAAERVWDGSARGNGWNDIGNWVGTGVPAAGDDLRFPAGALKPANVNDFAAGTSFHLLTYAGAGYTASGNEIGLTGGIVVSHGVGNTVLNLPISIALNQTFMVSVAGANLFLNGAVEMAGTRSILTFDGAGQTVVGGNISDTRVIVGGGTIRKNGTGTLYVLQNLTLGGPTIVNGGTLIMDGRMSNSAVTVNASATLRGNGKVGGLTVNSGGTVGPGLNLPAILDSESDVALNAGSTLNIRLNGTTAGINYDQVRVKGAVTLGGTLNVTAGFTAAVGDTFTIIENDGTDDTVGTFAGLPEGALLAINGRPFKISYGGRGGIGGPFGRDVNDVTLEAVPALAVWDGGGGLNKFWMEPLNWVGNVVPMPGDDVQFANAGSGTLITSNDFPAGRAIGKMIFIGGIHLAGGNLARINGSIQVNTGSDPDEPFRQVHLAMPLVLGANQTFEVNNPKAVLFTEAPIDLGGYNLTVRSHVAYSYISTEFSQITIQGGILGLGTLIKDGPGNVSLLSPSTGTLTIVNEGWFRLSAFYSSWMTGSAIVNNGGRIELEDDIGGDVTVNAGSVLTGGGFFGAVGGNVEINGGHFRPLPLTSIGGNLRMINGATYEVSVSDAGTTTFAPANGAVVNGMVELADCALQLNGGGGGDWEPGNLLSVLSHSNNGRTGTFTGLPEGSHVVVGGRIFGVHYRPSAVVLIVDEPFTWDGGGSGNLWTTGSNWVADFAPLPNATLIFPANVSKLAAIADFAAGTSFRQLLFGGPSYIVAGNPFSIGEGVFNDFASGETLINTDIATTSSSFEFGISNASRLSVEGRATGSAIWSKTGTGILQFSGTGTNSQNRMDVLQGELELAKPPGENSISRELTVGDGTNDVRVTLHNEHQIADTADVTIRNRARLDLNGNDETIDRLQGDGTVVLEGRFVPGRSGRLTVNSGNFSGALVGNGGLSKVGSSSLILSGVSTYSGLTILSGGILEINGIQINSPIRLNSGVLRGRGQVGTITGNLGGVLQPGFNGAAFQNTLHSGDVALNPATTFRPLLTSTDPDFENSQLQVSGAVALGGSILSVDLSGNFKPTNGFSFLIIDNDGVDPIVGTFAGLPEGAVFGGDGLPFRITYVGGTGNDVIITRVAAPASTLSSITRLGNGQMRIQGLGINGVIYPIQAASNLNPVIQWTQVGAGTGDANGVFLYLDTTASNRPMRFFRAVSP